MSTTLGDLAGYGVGGRLQTLAALIPASRSITVTADGWAVISAMGGGAGGAKNWTPGNSAGWGIKGIQVKAGDVIGFAIAAGGAPTQSSNVAAATGGDTVITLNGVTIAVAPGGEAGPANNTSKSPVTAVPTGMDFWMPGRQPQAALNYFMGGAAVDLGGGTTSTSGANGDAAVAPTPAVLVGMPVGSLFAPFAIWLNSAAAGSAGVGATGGVASSLFGGGEGTSNTTGTAAGPGRGGSAGATSNTSVAGGAGLGYIRLYADVS